MIKKLRKLLGLVLIILTSALIWGAFRLNFTPVFKGIRNRIVISSNQPQIAFLVFGLFVSSVMWLLLKYGFSFNILDVKLPNIDTDKNSFFTLPVYIPVTITLISLPLLIFFISTQQNTIVSVYNISPGGSSEQLVGNELSIKDGVIYTLVAKPCSIEYEEIIDLECAWIWSGDPSQIMTDGNCVIRLDLSDDETPNQILTLITNQRFQNSVTTTTIRFMP